MHRERVAVARLCILGVTLLLGACAAGPGPAPDGDYPNIVLILADDQGYGDVGVYGGDIPTPHIDAIARAGVRFTDGYVTGASCVTSRCGLMTGRYQARFGCRTPRTVRIPPAERTFAEHLRARGYRTGLVGKWHLGSDDGERPLDRGFEEFYGFLGGIHPYFPAGQATDVAYYDLTMRNSGPLYRGDREVEEESYLTDALAREAADFIDRHSNETFFLFLSFNAVHVPLQVSDDYLDRVPERDHPRRRALEAMTIAMDDAVGRVMDRLRHHALEESTLVIYISDNGGDPPGNFSINGPLRGKKGQLYEGGIRVPWVMQWKGRIPPGTVYTEPVISLDIASTALAASGGTTYLKPRLDGINLMPLLEGRETEPPARALYWQYRKQSALRDGDWKIVRPARGSPVELYHLGDDIGETRDQAANHPEVSRELQEELDKLDTRFRGYRRVLSP